MKQILSDIMGVVVMLVLIFIVYMILVGIGR